MEGAVYLLPDRYRVDEDFFCDRLYATPPPVSNEVGSSNFYAQLPPNEGNTWEVVPRLEIRCNLLSINDNCNLETFERECAYHGIIEIEIGANQAFFDKYDLHLYSYAYRNEDGSFQCFAEVYQPHLSVPRPIVARRPRMSSAILATREALLDPEIAAIALHSHGIVTRQRAYPRRLPP